MDSFSYHSGSSMPEQPEKPPAFIEGAESFNFFPRLFVSTFRISFETQEFRPNHQITIRNNVDGWARDIYGIYRNGRWEFDLERDQYAGGMRMKFVLDGSAWMEGDDLDVSPDRDHSFDNDTVHFSPAVGRYLHGYDNLFSCETALQQQRVRGDLSSTGTYDVIIVGSGMGGGILADALSDKGKRTLVLEAGSLVFPTHITNLPGDWSGLPVRYQVGHYRNESGSDFLLGVQMGLGGRSVYWSGIIPRMHQWELASWPAEVQSYLVSEGYERAENALRKQQTLGPFQNDLLEGLRAAIPDYHTELLPRSHHQPNLDASAAGTNVLQASTGVFSTADLLLDSMAYPGGSGNDNLIVNLNHLVTHIETSAGKAVAVVCQDLVGNITRRYSAKYIVLAAGSLESPRIALQSRLIDANGKIGRGLTDHPAFFSRTYEVPDGTRYAGFDHHAKVFMYHKQASASNAPFNVEILINPKYWDVRLADDDLWKQTIASDQKTLVQMKFIFSSQLDDDNYVALQEEGSKLKVKVKRNLSGSDRWNEISGLRNQILSFFQIPVQNPDDYMHFGNEGTVHHAGGTLRMNGSGAGVVDENLKFNGYENLYACDVSVFPFIPAANPSLTLAALALRLADHLNNR